MIDRMNSHGLRLSLSSVIIPRRSRSLSRSLFLSDRPVDIGLVCRLGQFVSGSGSDEVLPTSLPHIVRRIGTPCHRSSEDDPTSFPGLDTGLSYVLASTAGGNSRLSGGLRDGLSCSDSLDTPGRFGCIFPERRRSLSEILGSVVEINRRLFTPRGLVDHFALCVRR